MGKNPLKTYAHIWMAGMAAPFAAMAAVAAPQLVFPNAFNDSTKRLLNYRTAAGAAGAAAMGVGALAGGFAAAPGVAAPAGSAAAGETAAPLAIEGADFAEGAAAVGAQSSVPVGASEGGSLAGSGAVADSTGTTGMDYLTGFTSVGGLGLGVNAALNQPKPPGVPRLPPTPTYAADSAAAAERRRKQALASYGPLSTIKTTPLGLGGGVSAIGA